MKSKMSRFKPIRLMEEQPSYTWLWWPVTALLVLASLLLGYWYGNIRPMTDPGQQARELQINLNQLSRAYQQLQHDKDQLTLLRDIDQLAANRQRQVYNDALRHINELNDKLAIYQGVLTPESMARGLQIRDLEVKQLGPQEYSYRLVFTQQDTESAKISAQAKIQLLGVDQDFMGELVVMPLNELSSDYPEEAIELQFQFFQIIEGQLSLPEQFSPVQIEVALIPERGNSQIRLFEWQLVE